MAMSLGDKLTLLRLQNGYAKEDAAIKLGVSEAEISAWEAGSATPDLNMLPKIAAFYSITTDALLNPDVIPTPAAAQQPQQNYYQTAQQPNYQQTNNQSYQQASAAQDDPVAQATQAAKGFVFGKILEFADSCVKTASHRATARLMFVFPFPLIIVAAYLFAGRVLHLWHPAWIMFLLIPCYYMVAASFRVRTRKAFFLVQPVPIVIVMLFLMLGFGLHAWSTAWMLFLIIPAYYWFVAVFVKGRKR